MSPHTCVPCVRSIQLRQKKVTKEKATPSLRPLRCATGQTCGGAVAGCAVELALRWRAPLGQPRRVRSRSMGASTPMPPHNRPAAGAASRGWTAEHPTAEQPHGPLLRSAPPAQRVALSPARGGRAQRWPVWMSDSRVPFTMRRGAQRPADQGSRLFERRAQRKASSAAHPAREHRRLPAAKRRDAACRVAFSLVTFSWRRKRKLLRRRAHTPASALQPGMRQIQCTSPGFDKLSPNGQLNRSDPDKLSPNGR